MRRPSGCNAGFTLIEMLVAIALMALMGVVCWRGLAFVANQRSAIEDQSVELAQLVRAFAQIERDLAERLPDIAVPPRATEPELPLAVSIVPMANGDAQLECVEEVKNTPNPLFRRVEVRVYAGASREHRLVELIGILPRRQ